MKKILLLSISVMFGFAGLNAQTLEKKIFVDFGPTGGTNAAITPSPDTNGNYWNNFTSATLGSVSSLVDEKNAVTGFNMTITDDFTINQSTNYGPNGTTQANLGDLAIDTATRDYLYLDSANGFPTGQFTISNLDPAKGYKFYVFASRPTASIRISQYIFNGASSYTDQVQTSDGTTGNIATLLKTPILNPNTSGVITIDLSIVSGGYAYINALKMEQYNTSLKVDAPKLNENNVRVYENNGVLYVNSVAVAISNIKVFDIEGRLIAEQKNVKSNTAVINNLKVTHQVYIVKITGEDNKLITKKVLN
jgi:hypothetical protein